MTTSQKLLIFISLVLTFPNNPIFDFKKNQLGYKSILSDSLITKYQRLVSNSDTLKSFVVDDFPVTNKMLSDNTSNNSSNKKQSGKTYSYGKAWFGNDSINQTILFDLYTDYHRMTTFLFYNNDIPIDLINRMELHIDNGEIAPLKQKVQDLGGFLKQSTKINSTFFTSYKGFKLGVTKQLAIGIYGEPDTKSMSDGIEKYEWDFTGDLFYDGKTDLKGKTLAKDSFGNNVIMYFRNGKLIGQILFNDIP